jgi:ubiquitin-protein ligase
MYLSMCSAGVSNTDSKIEAVAATIPSMNDSNTDKGLMHMLLNEPEEYPLVI